MSDGFGDGGAVVDGDQEARLAVGDGLGGAAGAAGDDRLGQQRRLDVDQGARLAARGDAEHVDGVHHVGGVAAEAGEADACREAAGAGGRFSSVCERRPGP